MIILRLRKILERLFSRRDPMPPENERHGAIKSISNLDIRIKLEYSSKYDRDINKLSPIDRETAKRLVKDLKRGYIYESSREEDDVHILTDFNKDDSHVLSKKISNEHRFNYRVRPPVIIKDNEGNITDYYLPIYVESCYGHGLSGKNDYFNYPRYKNK